MSIPYRQTCARPTKSASRSPIIIAVAFVLARTVSGITDASAIRKPSVPLQSVIYHTLT